MVHIMAAAQVCNDTARVLHENNAVRLQSDGDRTLLHCTSQLLRVHWWHVDEFLNSHCLFRPVGLASITRESLVLIVDLFHDSVVLRVPQCPVHRPTETALISIDLRAVHKLLLAQINQLASLKEVCTLDNSSRCESPVRPTDVLILDR